MTPDVAIEGPACAELPPVFCSHRGRRDRDVKFSKIVFYAAGVWGIAILTLLYFSTGTLDRVPAPPVADPMFFYGFLAVTMAFQLVFLVIGSDPVRFRPLMFPSLVEKFGFIVSMVVLFSRGRVTQTEF